MKNKIVITDNFQQSFLNKIKVDYIKETDPFSVSKLSIKICEDADLEIVLNSDNLKLNILIEIEKNVIAHIYEKKLGSNLKIKYEVNVNKNATLHFDKLATIKELKEFNLINLEDCAKIIFNQKTIATSREKYDVLVNHNGINTKCDLNNDGVAIKNGIITFNVTNMVPSSSKNSYINQNSNIVKENKLDSIINPNLLIDELEVEASHSAHIGPFNEEEIFYLESRGINYQTALNLLVKGFILRNMNISDEEKLEIKKIIDKYWR